MKERFTTKCRSLNQAEFRLLFEDHISEVQIDWLIGFLEDQARTEDFVDGQFLRTGWMVNGIRLDGDYFTLREPDFISRPMVTWIESATSTVQHLFQQRWVAESVGLEYELNWPSLRHWCILCKTIQDHSTSFKLQRDHPSGKDDLDSGWFIGCLDPQHRHDQAEDLYKMSLYECVVINPALVRYLALPYGTMVIENGDDFYLETEPGVVANIVPGSYLDVWCKQEKKRKIVSN